MKPHTCLRNVLALLFGVALVVAKAAQAAPPPVESQSGDAAMGQKIAQAGAPNGVTACVSCHGSSGQGTPGAGFPRLAGQSQYYLKRQLDMFANGSRNNGVMSPIAKAMGARQRMATAAYYTALASPAAPLAAPDQAKPEAVARGRMLAESGDESLRVQSCANCHGPGGVAGNPAFPYLAGQHQDYLRAAMAEWKSGARNTDPSRQMPSIAALLNDDDIAAVATYYASQAAPPPSAAQARQPAANAGKRVAPARKSHGSAGGSAVHRDGGTGGNAGAGAAQGTGTEQGGPTSGGNQGPGGGGGAKAGPAGP